MYCIKCGTKLPLDSKFCTKCGAPVEEGKNISTFRTEQNKANEKSITRSKTSSISNRQNNSASATSLSKRQNNLTSATSLSNRQKSSSSTKSGSKPSAVVQGNRTEMKRISTTSYSDNSLNNSNYNARQPTVRSKVSSLSTSPIGTQSSLRSDISKSNSNKTKLTENTAKRTNNQSKTTVGALGHVDKKPVDSVFTKIDADTNKNMVSTHENEKNNFGIRTDKSDDISQKSDPHDYNIVHQNTSTEKEDELKTITEVSKNNETLPPSSEIIKNESVKVTPNNEPPKIEVAYDNKINTISFLEWFIILILMAIPIVNIIVGIVWIISGNRTKRNYALASLVIFILTVAIMLYRGYSWLKSTPVYPLIEEFVEDHKNGYPYDGDYDDYYYDDDDDYSIMSEDDFNSFFGIE